MRDPKKPVKLVMKSAPIPTDGKLEGWRRNTKDQLDADLKAVIPPKLMKVGLKFFGSEQEFWKWLRKKPLGLHPDRGIDIMGTKEGQARIINLLGQIDAGVF